MHCPRGRRSKRESHASMIACACMHACSHKHAHLYQPLAQLCLCGLARVTACIAEHVATEPVHNYLL